MKAPGGGITIFDFILKKFIGLSKIILVTSLIASFVGGRELAIVSTSASRVAITHLLHFFHGFSRRILGLL